MIERRVRGFAGWSAWVVILVLSHLICSCLREEDAVAIDLSPEPAKETPGEQVDEPEDEPLDVDAVLRNLHYLGAAENSSRSGKIRTGASKLPMQAYRRGDNTQVQPHSKEEGRWLVAHGRFVKRKFEAVGLEQGATPGSLAEFDALLAETAVSRWDLMMPYLHWPEGELLGEEKTTGQKCWLIRLINPERGGSRDQVRVWVQCKFGLLIQLVAYDEQGRATKRLRVSDIMRVGKKSYV